MKLCRSKVPTPAKAPGFEAFVAGTGALGPGMTEAQIVRVFGQPAQKTEKDRLVTLVFALNGVPPGAAEVQLMGDGFVHAVFTRTDSGAAVPAIEAAAAKRIATGPLAQKAVMYAVNHQVPLTMTELTAETGRAGQLRVVRTSPDGQFFNTSMWRVDGSKDEVLLVEDPSEKELGQPIIREVPLP